jgi:hypothetical protein
VTTEAGAAGRKALVVATYQYADSGLRQLAAPEHDAESFAEVLEDAEIAGFDVTMLVNQPHYVVGEAIADFYADCHRDDLTLLYFSGHGLKDDEGRLHLAMTNTRREALLFTAISAEQLNAAMDGCASRRKVLILDCCYSGAFPVGRQAKADDGVQTLERFQGKGRAVLTASDATQYAFEGDDLTGAGTSSVFTRYLVEAIRSGEADLDEDGDIALDELYSYVREKVVAEVPQQRPKKQEDVDGRIVVARNVHWQLPDHLRYAIESPISAQRLSAVEGLGHLHRVGNDAVRAAVTGQLTTLTADDSRSVSAAATALLAKLQPAVSAPAPAAAPATAEAPTPVPPRAAPVVVPPVAVVVPTPQPPPPEAGTRTELASEAAQPAVPAPQAPVPAQQAAVPAPEVAVPAQPGFPNRLVLSLVVVGGLLQVLSRFLVFDATNGNRAADSNLATPPWLLCVALPVLVAVQLLLLRGREEWALALSGGLVLGAGLGQLDQGLAVTAYDLSSGGGSSPGPAFWAAVLGAVVLLAATVVILRGPTFRTPTRLRRDWRAVVAAVVVFWALAVRLNLFSGVWMAFVVNEPAVLLAVACLLLVVLRLSRAQALLGLTAVTVFGVWACAQHVYALIQQTFPRDAAASAAGIWTALLSVAACYFAAAGSRQPDRP